jgi:hypothetical protein
MRSHSPFYGLGKLENEETTMATDLATKKGNAMIQSNRRTARFTGLTWSCLLTCAAVLGLGVTSARATENGASVYPVGVETVMTGMQPRAGETMAYEFSCLYSANEFINSQGQNNGQEFKLRVLATAFKVTRNWGLHFLGGTIESQIAVPMIEQDLHVFPGRFTKFAITNVDLVPVSVTYHTGHFHWYYEADMFTPGSAYSPNDVLNIGQHNLAIAPVAGVTYLSTNGRNEISSRYTYIINSPDKATHYQSGNEFEWEFNADHSINRTVAFGVNGYLYKQTTDDLQNGLVFLNGFRGRDLAIGPQIRIHLGKRHGGFAIKYYRDTLVQNKPAGNAFWFQIGVPLSFRPREEN